MKSLNKAFVISVVVLGFGTVSNVSAATSNNAELALKQVVVNQSLQVTKNVTEQLTQSIKSSLSNMALPEKTVVQSSVKVASTKKGVANKNNSTAEEE